MTPNEAAQILGCHENTIKRLVSAGQITAYRWGSGKRQDIHIKTEDLEAFLTARRVPRREE